MLDLTSLERCVFSRSGSLKQNKSNHVKKQKKTHPLCNVSRSNAYFLKAAAPARASWLSLSLLPSCLALADFCILTYMLKVHQHISKMWKPDCKQREDTQSYMAVSVSSLQRIQMWWMATCAHSKPEISLQFTVSASCPCWGQSLCTVVHFRAMCTKECGHSAVSSCLKWSTE